MSSYLSRDIEYNPVTSSVNLGLINKVLEVKNERWDANVKSVQDSIDQLGSIDLIGDGRKQYFQDRVQGLVDYVNTSGNINFERGNVKAKIDSQVKNILDAKVVNDIANTRKFRTFQAGVDKLKESKPELYNDVNYQYALETSGFNDWANESADKYGNLSYTAFTDYSKELKDISQNLDKYDTEIKKVTSIDGGYIWTKEGKEITSDKVKAITSQLLSDGAKKQMQINGWATYDQGNSPEEKLQNVTSKFTEYKNNKLKEIDGLVDQYTTLLKNDPENENYKANLKYYKERQKSDADTYDEVIKSGNKSQMYTSMYVDNVTDSFAKTFAFSNIFENVTTDSNYWAEKNYDYKVAKDALDRADKQKEKETADAEGIQTKINPTTDLPSEQQDFYTKQEEYIKSVDSNLEAETARVYETLDQTTKNTIDQQVAKSGGKLTKADALVALAKTSSNIVSIADARALDNLRIEQATEKEKFTNYMKEATEAAKQSLDTESMVESLASNPNIKIMARGKDGVERLFPAVEVFKANGIINEKGKKVKSLKAFPEVFKNLQASLYADKALSNGVNPPGNNPNDKRLGVSYDNPKAMEYIEMLANTLGESISDVFIKNSQAEQLGIGKHINLESKTGRYLNQHRQQGGYNRAGIFASDDSFDDIPEADQFLQATDFGKIKQDVAKKLEKDATLAINRTTLVSPKTKPFNDLKYLVGDAMQAEDSNSIVINYIPSQPGMMRISQVKEITNKGEIIPKTKIADVRIADLPASITREIDLQNKKATLTTKNLPPVSSPVKYGSFDDNRRVLDLANNIFNGDRRAAETTTKEGALDLMFKNPVFAQVTGTIEAPTPTGQIIKKVIDDPNLTVKLNKTEHGVFPQVVTRVNGDEKLIFEFRDPIPDDEIQNVYDQVRFAPQIYVNTLLQGVLKEKSLPNSTNHVLNKLTQIYGQ